MIRFLSILFVLVAFLLWVMMPGSQSDLLKTQLKEAENSSQNPTSNAFVYLLGMDAPPGADPMLLGKKRLPIYQASADPNFNTEKYGDVLPSSMPVVAGVLLCKATELNCMAKLFTETHARNDSLNSSGYFVARYNTYKQFRDFRHIERITYSSLLPSYRLPSIGQRLFLLDQIQQIDKQQITPAQMQTHVLADLDYWRTELVSSDHLVHKMVVTALVHNDLNMLAEMQMRYSLKTPPLAALTLAERSMRKILINEVYSSNFVLNEMAGIQSCKQYNYVGARCTSFLNFIHLLYKKEDTANLMAEHARNIIDLSELPLEQLYKQRKRKESWQIHIPLSQYFRNSMGTFSLKAGDFDYSIYVFRVTDLNLQIALLNAVSNVSAPQKPFAIPENIVNPYTGAKTTAYLDPAGGLCLPSALNDAQYKQNGCIPWR